MQNIGKFVQGVLVAHVDFGVGRLEHGVGNADVVFQLHKVDGGPLINVIKLLGVAHHLPDGVFLVSLGQLDPVSGLRPQHPVQIPIEQFDLGQIVAAVQIVMEQPLHLIPDEQIKKGQGAVGQITIRTHVCDHCAEGLLQSVVFLCVVFILTERYVAGIGRLRIQYVMQGFHLTVAHLLHVVHVGLVVGDQMIEHRDLAGCLACQRGGQVEQLGRDAGVHLILHLHAEEAGDTQQIGTGGLLVFGGIGEGADRPVNGIALGHPDGTHPAITAKNGRFPGRQSALVHPEQFTFRVAEFDAPGVHQRTRGQNIHGDGLIAVAMNRNKAVQVISCTGRKDRSAQRLHCARHQYCQSQRHGQYSLALFQHQFHVVPSCCANRNTLKTHNISCSWGYPGPNGRNTPMVIYLMIQNNITTSFFVFQPNCKIFM